VIYSKHRFKKAVYHFLVGKMVQSGATLVLLLLLVRVLNLEAYGIYVTIYGMVEFLFVASSFGFMQAPLRFIPEIITNAKKQDFQRFIIVLFSLRVFSLVIIGTILFFNVTSLALWLNISHNYHNALYLGILLIFFVLLFRFSATILEAQMEQKEAQLLRALGPLLRLGLIIIALFYYSTGELILTYVLLIDVLVFFILVLLASYRCYIWTKNRELGEQQQSFQFGQVWLFMRNITGVNLLRSLGSKGGVTLIIASTIGLKEAGLFVFIQQLVRQSLRKKMPSVMFRNLIMPMLVSRYKKTGHSEKVQRVANLLMLFNLIPVGIGITLAVSQGDKLIELLSGGKYLDAGWFLMLFIIILGAKSQGSVLEMLMMIFDKTKWLFYTSIIMSITGPVVYLTSQFGLLSVIITLLFMVYLQNILRFVILRQHLPHLGVAYSILIRLAIAIFISAACSLFINNIYIACVIGILTYLVMLVVIKPISQTEFELFKNLGIGRGLKIFQLITQK
jgi:O-antigen/teichoic acid export membrane protein